MYFAVQTADPKEVNTAGGGDNIYAAGPRVTAQLGIDPSQHILHNHFQ